MRKPAENQATTHLAVANVYTSIMVDRAAHKKAHTSEPRPACSGIMQLGRDRYTCEKCKHFEQAIELQDNVERDDPANLTECKCEYCLKRKA